MKLSQFQSALSKNADQHLAIVLPNGNPVPAHFHVTEVGRAEKRFVDCGGKIRHSVFANLQVWIADDLDHRLPAGKLSTIIESADGVLGNDDPEMQFEFQENSISLFSVEGFEVNDGTIAFSLANKQTTCLALEVCVPEGEKEEGCCGSTSSCCG